MDALENCGRWRSEHEASAALIDVIVVHLQFHLHLSIVGEVHVVHLGQVVQHKRRKADLGKPHLPPVANSQLHIGLMEVMLGRSAEGLFPA